MRIANKQSGENAPGTQRSPSLPLVERPRLRSREEGGRPTTWLELFFDLVFVVAIDQVARLLQSDASLSGFLKFAALYVPVWWAWIGYVIYTDRFGTDDLSDRLFTLAQMAAVLVLAVRAHDAFGPGGATFAVAYGVFRLILAVRYCVAGMAIAKVRRVALLEAVGFTAAAALWLASAAVAPPQRFWLWGMGFVVDLATPLLARDMHLAVPPDPEHLEERFGTFVNIVLGEGFIGLVEGMRDIAWTGAAELTGALALVVGFAIWWIYFETLDVAPMRRVAARKETLPYKLWLFSHLPLAAGIAASGIAVGAAVHRAAKPPFPDGERWLLAGGIALCFAAFALLQVAYALGGGGRERWRFALLKTASALAALGIAAAGRGLSAPAVVALIAAVTVPQVVLDLWRRSRIGSRHPTAEQTRRAMAAAH